MSSKRKKSKSRSIIANNKHNSGKLDKEKDKEKDTKDDKKKYVKQYKDRKITGYRCCD
jgi:hypothetical protein